MFPPTIPPPTKRLPPTRRFAVYFSQKAWLHFARDTKILTLNQSKNCFSYTLEFCFPLRYPFRTKSFAPTQLFARCFSQKAWFL